MESGQVIAAGSTSSWEELRAVCAGASRRETAAVATGWGAVDRVLPGGGLVKPGVHEWIVGDDGGARGLWVGPLAILSHLAGRAVRDGRGVLVWIGRAVWPHPPTLVGGRTDDLLARSIFVNAARVEERVWAMDLALRSGAVAAVIADGSGFDLSATRRLQLAGEAGGALGLLARRSEERGELSAAATRWVVRTAPCDGEQRVPARRWIVELLRCKGAQPTGASARRWILEHLHAPGHGLVASELLDRSGDAAAVPRRRSG